MPVPTVPLAVGTANLGSSPRSQIGDPNAEFYFREYYRKRSGKWNRLQVVVPPGGTVTNDKLNSGNLRVSNVLLYAFPVVVGGAVQIAVTESLSGGRATGPVSYMLLDTQKQEYPGPDDRAYWTVQNLGADTVQFTIMYQTAGEY